MDRRSFGLGIVAGILLCLIVPKLASIHVARLPVMPDSPTNLALVVGTVLGEAPQRLPDFYTDDRRASLTQAEIDYLAKLWRETPGGTDFRVYVALRRGAYTNPDAKTVFFWAVPPDTVGNRYWQIEDIAVMDAAEFDAHTLVEQLKTPE